MHFPKQRIRFTKTADGRRSEQGYLVLDLKGLDIEGVTSFEIDIADIEAARSAGDKQDEARAKLKDLLG